MTIPRGAHARVSAELVTIRDWIRWANTEFADADLYYGHGTDEPWDEALALIGGALRVPPDRLESLLDARVLGSEGEALALLVRRRVEERVPVPYLVGRAWLAGLEFIVDERVLIPRSPLAHLLVSGLDPWLSERPVERILDLCTGSGCLGILAALACPDAEVVLADLSEPALAVAARNVARFGLGDRVHLLSSDGLDALAADARFDLVLCNPPYVDAPDLAAMPPEFRHEPTLALAGGSDGLDLVARILAELPGHLERDGLLMLEVGNSLPALLARWPRLPFLVPDLEHGGTGVVLLRGDELERPAHA